jgi:hypothetical protein
LREEDNPVIHVRGGAQVDNCAEGSPFVLHRTSSIYEQAGGKIVRRTVTVVERPPGKDKLNLSVG